MKHQSITRRRFLGGVAGGFAVAGLSRSVAANDKLNIAGIGVGGRGHQVVREVSCENIVALCDVDKHRGRRTFKMYPKAKTYQDYRVMLEKQKDIDAVIIATPDHTHAFATMAALELGKHVYCEKPLTHSIYEARRVAEAARKAGVATQMGNNGQASEATRLTCEYILDGAIGPVREVHVWTNRPIWPQGIPRPTDKPPVPKSLDWDLWLGPAPERPYHPIYHPFKWRGWWDFGTGALGDIGCHSFHPVFRALNLRHPVSVEATSTYKGNVSDETFPLASIVSYQFPARGDMPEVSLTWYDGGLKPPQPGELDTPLDDNGTLYIGDKGKMLGSTLIPASKHVDYGKPPQVLERSPGHFQEWLRACKGGEPAGSNFDIAALVTEVVLLGNIALRSPGRLDWDGEKITNVPEMNQYLRREYRDGWLL